MVAQIELVDISKHYTIGDLVIKAVDAASLKIERGDFLSIVGHSGSGKTTLLSLVGGIIRPTSGKVFVDGLDLYSLNDEGLSQYRNEKIGFMFQFASLLPILTAKENVRLPILFNSNPRGDSERTAMDYLDMVGLADKASAYPSQLSGGQQRRVAIARALMNNPQIILADEPTGDLDEETEREIMVLFKKLNTEQNVTFIFITHNMELARQARRQIRMSNGSLIES